MPIEHMMGQPKEIKENGLLHDLLHDIEDLLRDLPDDIDDLIDGIGPIFHISIGVGQVDDTESIINRRPSSLPSSSVSLMLPRPSQGSQGRLENTHPSAYQSVHRSAN